MDTIRADGHETSRERGTCLSVDLQPFGQCGPTDIDVNGDQLIYCGVAP